MDAAPAPDPALRPTVWAGVAAGSVVVAVFSVFHTLYIAPVPAVVVEGALWALGAGAAVGWAYHRLQVAGALPTGWRGGVALALALWLLLAPYEALGVAFGPLTHLTRAPELAAVAPVGLLSAPFAAALAYAWTRDRRTAGAAALATALCHFMVGGSIVYFGGRGVILWLWLAMLPTYVLAGLVLVRARDALLARSRAADASGDLRSTRSAP